MRVYVREEDYEVVSKLLLELGIEPRCELYKKDGVYLVSWNLRKILADGDMPIVRELRKYVRISVAEGKGKALVPVK